MNKDNFFDIYFKFLVLSFWPIFWYENQLILNTRTNFIIFITFSILYIIYILLFTYYGLNNSSIDKIVIYYRVSMLLAFIFTIISFLLFPTNPFFFILKIIFVFILLYISYIKVRKYKIEEGVVGILSALLMLAFALFY